MAVEELVKRVIERLGEGAYRLVPDRALHESELLKLDIVKARTRLGWHPRLSLDETIRYTTEWYRTYYKNPSAIIDTTDTQIADYFAL